MNKELKFLLGVEVITHDYDFGTCGIRDANHSFKKIAGYPADLTTELIINGSVNYFYEMPDIKTIECNPDYILINECLKLEGRILTIDNKEIYSPLEYKYINIWSSIVIYIIKNSIPDELNQDYTEWDEGEQFYYKLGEEKEC